MKCFSASVLIPIMEMDAVAMDPVIPHYGFEIKRKNSIYPYLTVLDVPNLKHSPIMVFSIKGSLITFTFHSMTHSSLSISAVVEKTISLNLGPVYRLCNLISGRLRMSGGCRVNLDTVNITEEMAHFQISS